MGKSGVARIPLLREMAQLGRGASVSVSIYSLGYYLVKSADLDPLRVWRSSSPAMKYAERSKNWAFASGRAGAPLWQLVAASKRSCRSCRELGTVYSAIIWTAPMKRCALWRRVPDAQPGNARAMRVLRDTYLRTADYDALEEACVAQERSGGPGGSLVDWPPIARATLRAKLDLSYRAAAVYEDRFAAIGA